MKILTTLIAAMSLAVGGCAQKKQPAMSPTPPGLSDRTPVARPDSALADSLTNAGVENLISNVVISRTDWEAVIFELQTSNGLIRSDLLQAHYRSGLRQGYSLYLNDPHGLSQRLSPPGGTLASAAYEAGMRRGLTGDLGGESFRELQAGDRYPSEGLAETVGGGDGDFAPLFRNNDD